MPAVSKIIVSSGTMHRPASTRGTSRYWIGLTAMVSSASTCSVTRIVPELGAHRGAGAHGHHQRGEHRGQLAGEGQRHRGADQALGVEELEGARRTGVANTMPENVPGEGHDEDGPHPHEVELGEEVLQPEGGPERPGDHRGPQRDQAPDGLEHADDAVAHAFHQADERVPLRAGVEVGGGHQAETGILGHAAHPGIPCPLTARRRRGAPAPRWRRARRRRWCSPERRAGARPGPPSPAGR